MEEGIETTNINLKWLENIYNQITILQDLERMSREGCKTLIEYLQIPLEMQQIIIPEAQYKNMRFMALEIDILISNLTPIIGEGSKHYAKLLQKIIINIDNRNLFIKTIKKNNINHLEITPFLTQTVSYLVSIKSNVIKNISSILFIKDDKDKKKW